MYLSVKKRVRMGMTFGGFDLCHMGHINLLRQAKSRCDHLIVCISSDEYMMSIKRVEPLLTYKDRVYLVRKTGYANKIIKQDVDSKERLINEYKPDVLFVGNDWNKNTYSGQRFCKVEYLKHTKGVSSTWYREKICER